LKLQEFKRPDGKPVYSIVLPKVLVESKQWKKGQKLKTEFDSKGNIILKEGN